MEDSASSSIPPSIWASMNSWFTPTILFIFLNLMIATILFTSTSPNHHNNPQDHKETQKENHKENQKPQNDVTQSKLPRSPSLLHRLRSFNFTPYTSQLDPSAPPQPQPQPQHHHQLQEQESLEIAATQYVFNHPFPDDLHLQPLSTNPDNSDPGPASSPGLDSTRPASNVETHFFFEKQHTVERVTTHFDFGTDPVSFGSDLVSFGSDPVDSGFLEGEEKDEFQSLDEVYSSITNGGGQVNRTKSDTVPASGEVPVKLPAKMKKSASLKSAFSHFEEEKIVEARRPATVKERRSAARAADADDVEVDAKADDFINKFKQQLKLQRLDSIIRYKDMVSRGGGK